LYLYASPMIAELLSVGTELLLGEIIDTNSAFLAQDLARRGVDILWSQRVGDNLGRVSAALESALSRSDAVVVCGGLGPTDDDLTREAIAKVLGETPAVDPALEEVLRARFARYGLKKYPERNIKQAWLIPSAEALPNPQGTAPGWFVRTTREGKARWIIALPGPPRELEPMWLNEVVGRLELPPAALYSKTFKTHNIGESTVAELLGVLTDGANPSVATYAKRDGVHVRVAAKADSPEAAKAIANDVEGQVRTLLLDTLWGEDTDELAAVILKTLQAKNKTLATMESLTGGLLGDFITSVPGASTIYEGGVVAYTLKQKAAFGVSEAILEAHGAVSAETAQEMARAAATRFESDYGLATTGVAGPDNAEGKPVGEIYLAVFDAQTGQETVKRVQFPPLERNWVRERAAFAALSLLFSTLNG
jgi:nicotinamide-nucleotide amidase